MTVPSEALVFDTTIGWCGLLSRSSRLHHLVIGCESPDLVWQELRRRSEETGLASSDSAELQKIRERITAFLEGEPDLFLDLQIQLAPLTQFQQQVLKKVRQIPVGELKTYGEIAAACGRPQAARAVGGALSRNPLPLIVPCHRVVGAGGMLTGFTAPRGIQLKQQLLDLEQNMLSCAEFGC
ncbi:MAG: methylated-DNA--[protein]-cysteine S-methyltransferase [Planctomycetaceae bacterium]|nr:methylated-DNA--[protein]-cysteine S-methyltransferase [Planctomycetaceae bacterium]